MGTTTRLESILPQRLGETMAEMPRHDERRARLRSLFAKSEMLRARSERVRREAAEAVRNLEATFRDLAFKSVKDAHEPAESIDMSDYRKRA